jgi:DEAD/DEAH box helicase domain-containing protein
MNGPRLKVSDFVESFPVHPAFKDKLSHHEILPKRSAMYKEINPPLLDCISDFLKRKSIHLFSHQVETIEAIRRKENVILTTPTASGKTLSYLLPLLEILGTKPEATSLFLYPTKALANDQLKTFQELERETSVPLFPQIYDGDTPQGIRSLIRSKSRAVLTNPYEIHQILPWHSKWIKFYSHLSMVVLDEAHSYRGVFGSNVALLVRRLRRICQFYGSKPQWILSSATLANAEEFSEKLVGYPFTWIKEDGSPKGEKHFFLVNPFFDGESSVSATEEARKLFQYSMEQDLQTLCFTGSRKSTELISYQTKAELERKGSPLATKVSPYRAGYLAEDRRKIENNLKNGSLMGVVSTNALEVGIDIGSLDSVILTGFPGTMISTWQQVGRSGRGLLPSLAFLIAFQNPLDQYLMNHPEEFFGKDQEHAIIDLNNPYILSGHLLCACAELPLQTNKDQDYFGELMQSLLSDLGEVKIIQETPAGWVYVGTGRAVDAVKLNSISSDSFRIVVGGKVLETLERSQAYREAHPGAVFLHMGESYHVESFDHERNMIVAKKEEADFYTEVMKDVSVTIQSEEAYKIYRKIKIALGHVLTEETYYSYQVKRKGKNLGQIPLNLPEIEFETIAFWFEVPSLIRNQFIKKHSEESFMGAIHGIEHAMIGIMPFYVMCDRWDIGGFSTSVYPETGEATIFIYDGFEGGIGLSEKGYELFPDLLEATYKVIKDCPCESENGCPACIQSPKCGNENQTLDKAAAIEILEKLLGIETVEV